MWQERLFPELKMIESQAERLRLLTEADQQTVGLGKRLAFIVVVATIVGAVAWLVFATITKWWAIPRWSIGASTAATCIVACVLGVQVFWRRPLRIHIRQALSQRGIPLCLGCGYNLTGNVSGTCPECGGRA